MIKNSFEKRAFAPTLYVSAPNFSYCLHNPVPLVQNKLCFVPFKGGCGTRGGSLSRLGRHTDRSWTVLDNPP